MQGKPIYLTAPADSHTHTMIPADDLKLLRINFLRGPNIWTYPLFWKSGSIWVGLKNSPPTKYRA